MFKFTELGKLHSEFSSLINDQDLHAPIALINAWHKYFEQAASTKANLSPVIADELAKVLENEAIPEQGWTSDLVNLTLVYFKTCYDSKGEDGPPNFVWFYNERIGNRLNNNQPTAGLLDGAISLLQSSEKRMTGPAAFYAVMQGRLAKQISDIEKQNKNSVLKAYCRMLNSDLPLGDYDDAQSPCLRYLKKIREPSGQVLSPARQTLSMAERIRVALGGSPAGIAPGQRLIVVFGVICVAAAAALFGYNQNIQSELEEFRVKFIKPYEGTFGSRSDD